MRWYFCFFLISGFCSLVYEIVWLRLSMAEFGVTAAMLSIVLSMFMAGLALGSWCGGALMRRVPQDAASIPLRFYALTELLIGISARIVPHQLRWGHTLALGVGHAAPWQSSAYYLLSGLWVAVTLIPWCSCMGATFPLLMAVIRRTSTTESQHSFSYLYIANVLGALLGTALSAFVLIELVGFRGTLRIGSILNALLAAWAFLISLAPPPSCWTPDWAAYTSKTKKLYGLPETGVLWMLFATGAVSMAMEVVWIRQFSPYVGNVVYAFAMILAIYLVATYEGSSKYRLWVRSHAPGESHLLWALSGLLGLLPLVTADPRLPRLVEPALAFPVGVLRVALGIGAFCGCVGFLTPMLVDHWACGDPNRAGKAYAINVLGCIVGPLLSGFCLLPRLGERWALVALCVPLFVVGTAATLSQKLTVGQVWSRLDLRSQYALVMLAAVLAVTMTRGYETVFPERAVLRDYAATVVATGTGFQKQLLVNGVGMTRMTPVTKFMAHLPTASMRRRPQNGLVVCFGMGTTFRSMLSWGIPSTAVDLVPSVPTVFGYFHPDAQQLLASPLAKVVVDDGRRFLDGSASQYDVITVDPPPPPGATGSSLLYSREFYQIVRRRLRPGGILQQWYPDDPGDAVTRASITRALEESFPHVRAFRSVEGWGIHFLASEEPLPVEPARVLAARLPASAAADLVEWGPGSTAQEQFEKVLAGEQPVDRFIAGHPDVLALNDDRPINEYFLLRGLLHPFRRQGD